MKTTLFQIDSSAARKTACDEIFNDYRCKTILLLTDEDAGTLSSLLLRMQLKEPLTDAQTNLMDNLANALGGRRCEDLHTQVL